MDEEIKIFKDAVDDKHLIEIMKIAKNIHETGYDVNLQLEMFKSIMKVCFSQYY